MPNKYQDNLGCAKQYNRNEGLCPGDSGNTVGEKSDFTNFLKQNYDGISVQTPKILFNSTEGALDLRELFKYGYDRQAKGREGAPQLTSTPNPRTNKQTTTESIS